MKPLHILVVFTIFLMSNFDSYSTQSLCTELGVITTQTLFDSDIQQLLYAKEDRSEMYVRTENKIYHTTNTGSTWTDVTPLIPDYYNTTLSAVNGKYGVYWMTTAYDSIVYLQGYGYVFWMTRDGKTFKKQETYPNYLYSIKPHPNDYQYALRLLYVSSLRYYQLQLSDQGGLGDSWAPVKDNVTSYSWGGLHDQIYVIGMPDGSSAWNGAESKFFIFNIESYNTASLDYESEPGYTAMLFTENVLYIGKQSTDPRYLDLFLSDDFGSSFSPAVFTNPQNQQVNATKYFVESSNEQVSMIVSTLSTNSHIGDLYTADVSDGQYTISLPNIVVNSYSTDIQEIYALRGTFFANSYNITEEDRNNPNAVINDRIRSAITFDKGGVWLPISVINSSCSIEDECPLNLFSYTSESTSLRSTNYSVGVVLGTGNEGAYRKPIEEEANLYLSRNGGYSFEMVRSGLWDYSSAAHSSILLISSWEEALNSISYSWNQGESWQDCIYLDTTLSDLSGYSNVTLDAIRTVGQISDTKFLLIGDVQNNVNATDIRTVFISFDFSLLQSLCVGYDIPGEEESDYEIWTPETTSSCLLGVKTSYVRRKRSSSCYSPHDETSSSPVTCPCTRSDYTCDGECWEERREGGETVCVNICVNTPYDPQLPPSPCIGSYSLSQGYRKVEGDQCEGGDSYLYEPITVICPSVSSSPTPSSSLSPSFTPSVTATQSFSPSAAPSSVYFPPPSATPDPSSTSIPVIQSDPSQTSSSNVVTSGEESSNGDGNDNNNNNDDNGDDNNGLAIGLTILSVLILLIVLFIILIILIILYKTNSRVRNILSKCLPSRCKEVDEKKLYSVLGEETDFDNSLTAHFTELEETSSPVSNNSSILSPLPVLFKPDEN